MLQEKRILGWGLTSLFGVSLGLLERKRPQNQYKAANVSLNCDSFMC